MGKSKNRRGHPAIVEAALKGDVSRVRELIELHGSEHQRRMQANSCRRREEIVDKGCYTNDYSWHDMTPLTAAALKGHAGVVRFLLETCIADPTLEACPVDNTYFNAFQAQERAQKPHHECTQLLQAAKPFWVANLDFNQATHSSRRHQSGYTNAPTDPQAYLAAIAAVPGKRQPMLGPIKPKKEKNKEAAQNNVVVNHERGKRDRNQSDAEEEDEVPNTQLWEWAGTFAPRHPIESPDTLVGIRFKEAKALAVLLSHFPRTNFLAYDFGSK